MHKNIWLGFEKHCVLATKVLVLVATNTPEDELRSPSNNTSGFVASNEAGYTSTYCQQCQCFIAANMAVNDPKNSIKMAVTHLHLLRHSLYL